LFISRPQIDISHIAKGRRRRDMMDHGHTERRTNRRRTAHSSAWADPGGILPVIDCRIVDLSQNGARVIGPPGQDLPETFLLQVDNSRILGAAEVVWRESNYVGVRFLDPV
jgi:hypothetical protein